MMQFMNAEELYLPVKDLGGVDQWGERKNEDSFGVRSWNVFRAADEKNGKVLAGTGPGTDHPVSWPG